MTDDLPDILVPVLGTETRCWQYGDPGGETLILVHGFRGDHHGLEGLASRVAELAPELRIVVPDLPGFGASPAIPGREHTLDLFGEWLRAFAAGLNTDGYAVLGHSFGSLVVANAVSGGLEPDRVILINPIASPALEGPQAVLSRLAIAYYRAADLLPERPARALLGHPAIVRVMSEVMAKTADRELRTWIHGQHHSYFSRFSDTRSLLESFRASVSHTVAEYASAFDRPTLLIAGDRDDITPLAEQVALRNRLSDARLRVVPGVGHLVHYEAVDFASEEVVSFLRETTRAGERP